MLNPTKELGRVLGSLQKEQQVTNENLSPDEADSTLLLKQLDRVEVVGTLTVRRLYYDDNVFIIDHPVYGDIDSATLNIDGGYADAGPEWPWTWPSISWAEDVVSSTVYSTTF